MAEDFGHRFYVGHWLMVNGYWLLVIGYWSLVSTSSTGVPDPRYPIPSPQFLLFFSLRFFAFFAVNILRG
jgi:hypothetical protein